MKVFSLALIACPVSWGFLKFHTLMSPETMNRRRLALAKYVLLLPAGGRHPGGIFTSCARKPSAMSSLNHFTNRPGICGSSSHSRSLCESTSQGRVKFLTAFQSGMYGSEGGQEFRSEEHTSELQSRRDLVCRLLLEKK